jgi:hypothetical protein
LNTDASFEIVPVWKNVTSELSAELIDLWGRSGAIADPDKAALRAGQAVCVARDANGKACGVGTAVIRILPRLRQPMYFYRQFFAPEFRGHRQTVPFFIRARQTLEDHNAALAVPESLGVLLELENPQLAARYALACEPGAGTIFIGYSPQGFQLRVSYFNNAQLLPSATVTRRAQPGASL